jgi:RNA polymerase sigma factor (sigma-70 family)
MSSAQVAAVLLHIRKLAGLRHDSGVPDRQLLETFARDRDGDAFAALLGRHGPMVLGVCQSVLRNVHDAEDAFQAAFLLLARKAGSIHRWEAVSGWLYRVAYRLALRIQANAARRRVHERRAVTMPPADPVLDLSLRELRGVLLEELENLPGQYRAPLVLCALEEKSREEAASLLGWSPSAVKGKLERGRELLRARLRRRGLDLPFGLGAAALALPSTPGRVSAALADATLRAALKAAAGKGAAAVGVSAEVAALVAGASKTMFDSKARIATVVLLAVGVAALGVAWRGALAAGPPGPEQNVARKDQGERPGAEETTEVSGKVLDPEGKPLAGARVYLAWQGPKGFQIEERAASGGDGRFRFPVGKSERAAAGTQVLASAPGRGPDWVALEGTGPVTGLTLRLVKDVPVSGRFLDPDGRPVAGVTLTLTGVSAPRGDDVGGYAGAVRKGDWGYTFGKRWIGPLPGQPAVLTTGADGRFKLAGVGRERVVRFDFEGPGIAWGELEVMTRPAEKVVGEGRTLHGASFDYLAAASRPIRGVVRDMDTGKPVAGVSVTGWFNRFCKAVSDKEGRYELLGLAKSPDYDLRVKPAAGQLYFQRMGRFQDTAGLDALTADVEMVRGGVTVRGKVTDREGKPVAGARVDYYPLTGNASVRKVAGLWFPRAEATTGPDGSYAVTVLPGPGFIGVAAARPEAYRPAHVTARERKDFFKTPRPQDVADDVVDVDVGGGGGPVGLHTYHAVVLVEPGEKEEALARDATLEPALTLKGRVVGPDGRPLAGVTVVGLTRNGVETLPGSEFTVREVNPRVKLDLLFSHKARNLGLLLSKEVPADRSAPLTVRLESCGAVTGRIVDADDKPIPDLALGLHRVRVMGGRATLIFPLPLGGVEARTDRDGRFRADGLVPGVHYVVRSPRGEFFSIIEVGSGKVKDLGEARVPLSP